MDTKALRQKILDLAIRGKLVPQDPNDEPAEVLLKRIREQKQQMLKEGMIEIERTRSVSQAAENLFIGQPNLSRILHEMEANLGFKIFERTSKGVRSTERGAIFLQHAKSIIRELERIDALGPRHPVENRLRICIPRAAFILDLTAEDRKSTR